MLLKSNGWAFSPLKYWPGFPWGLRGCDAVTIQNQRFPVMDDPLLTPREAAARLGITVTTLYDWLGRSRYGLLEIRGQRVMIDYLQGGTKGQGRIRIEAHEVDRINELMRVKPRIVPARRPPLKRVNYPGITVKLGHPDRRVG